jgi:hypothetical protein
MKRFRSVGECVASKVKDKKIMQIATSMDKFIELQKIALKNNTSVSEIVRSLIDEFMESEKSNSEEVVA